MKIFAMSIAYVGFAFLLPCPALSGNLDQPAITAPIRKIGPTAADWIRYFGDDYEIVDMDFVTAHRSSPVVRFWITNGTTTARFGVDLVSNRQMLFSVESVSLEFLQFIGVDEVKLDSNGNAVLKQCWDAGCNRLRVNTEPSGHLGAIWEFHWD